VWSVAAVFSIAIIVLAATCLKLVTRDPGEKRLQAVIEKVESLDPELQSRICAHRANNIPKYRAALELFDCLEIDVVIEPPIGDSIAVYHPPVENHIGLSLDFLLQNESLPNGTLWLDVKDLSVANWDGFLNLLNGLIPKNRRGDIVIETSWREADVERAVLALREDGYMVSYYLPTEAAIECEAASTHACDRLREDVIRTTSFGFSHLSFDARAYPFVGTIRDQLPSSIRFLTWDITPAWPRMDLLREVDIYIIRFPNRFST
jgi:hypothetical protein